MGKGKSPAFQFYPDDWLSSRKIALMTAEQEGAYIRLLCYAWSDPDCSIPDDDTQLASLSRLGSRWESVKDLVRSCFRSDSKKPGRLINKRLVAEKKKQREFSKQRREAGLKSGVSRRSATNKRSTSVQRESNEPVEVSLNSLSSSSSSSPSSTVVTISGATPPRACEADFGLVDQVAVFLDRWNRTTGTRPCPDQFSIGSPQLLVDRFGNPAWREAWPKALEKFPLKPFPTVSVTQFLAEDFVRNVLNGHYDFDPKQARNATKRIEIGDGQRHNPANKVAGPVQW